MDSLVTHTSKKPGLCVQEPVVAEIFPTFGPKSGSTMLTIRGASLDSGNRREVTVGKAACKIQRLVEIPEFYRR